MVASNRCPNLQETRRLGSPQVPVPNFPPLPTDSAWYKKSSKVLSSVEKLNELPPSKLRDTWATICKPLWLSTILVG